VNRREMVAGNYMLLQVSRIIALFACTLAFHCSCTAAEVRTEEFTVEVKGRTLAIMRYAAEGVNTRPAVLMLHGARGFGVGHLAYVESATTLAVNGIDAYLVSYFGPGESVACSRMASCFDAWTETVADVTTAILKRPESSGRVGLLGFSLGCCICECARSASGRCRHFLWLHHPGELACGSRALCAIVGAARRQ
jgi:predicted alpha/beta hydrolase